jgi:hypothetical protein
MDHEPCRLLWGGSKGASMAWRSPTASMPWRRLLLGGVRPTADRPPGLVAAEPALSGLIPAQRPFNHGIRGNTGRKGNRHGHQVSGREAVHQAEHDPLVVARLALGPHPTATRERAPRRPLEQATTALVFADNAGSLRDILNQHKEQRPSRAASGTPIPRPTEATSTATACGRSSVSTACAPSGRRRWTRSGPRCASAPSRKARHPSRVADSGIGRVPTCAGRMQRPYPTGGEQHGRA